MAGSPPYSIPLGNKAKELHDDKNVASKIEKLKYDKRLFGWGRVKYLPAEIQQEWKRVFADQFDISDVAISRFDSQTTINYEPHGIVLVPFSDITLSRIDDNTEFIVADGCYTCLRLTKVKLLSNGVDILVLKLKAPDNSKER